MLKNSLIILIFLAVTACIKDKPNTTVGPAVQLSSSKKVYVINEGGFNNSNASVSLYDPETAVVIEDFYKSQNNLNLGDIAQSITSFNSDLYIVVNNSGKIVVCDDQFKYKTTINTFSSPRYLLPVSNSKAYVSDLFSNTIGVLNLNTNTFTASIPCPGWTEKMVLIYNKVFVTNMKRNFVYVINAINDTKTDSIDVGPSAGNILLDKNDNVWVLSGGTSSLSINATLKKIDPVTNSVTATFTFANGEAPGSLCFNKTKDTLYFINNGIYRFPVSDNLLPQTPFIPANNRNFYGLGFNTDNYTLYAADALDYVQKSNIYIYDTKGNQLSFFKAGIISNGFYFE